MNFRIEKVAAGLDVRIEDVAGGEQMVLEKIRSCRQSAWACPSGECMKIGAMEEHLGNGCVSVTLIPRLGEQLNPAGIEECLRYVLPQATKAQ